MTKDDLCKIVAQKTKISERDVETVLNQVIASVKKEVAKGETVHLRGFGSFSSKTRAEKKGRDISRNKEVIIPEHKVPYFKVSKEFKNQIAK
jgi:DNA-binding protein HU-beta